MSIPRIESSVVTEFDPVCSCTRPMCLYSTLMAEVWMRLCSMYVLYGSYDNHIAGSQHNLLLGHTHLSESMFRSYSQLVDTQADCYCTSSFLQPFPLQGCLQVSCLKLIPDNACNVKSRLPMAVELNQPMVAEGIIKGLNKLHYQGECQQMTVIMMVRIFIGLF